MNWSSEQPGRRRPRARGGFTLIEVAAAVLIIAGICATTLVVMNRCVEAAINLRNRERAFELARENLEFLLTGLKAREGMEYGFDEVNPEVQWQIAVEPFYEPISNRMWIRAVSSAEYLDTQGERQTVELEHWLTGLTPQQVKMIEAQRKAEEEFLDSLYGEDESQRQELTRVFLEQQGLDVDAYEQFLNRQREQKMAYLEEYGYDDGYETLLQDLREAEDRFLLDQGVDWEEYRDFYNQYLGEAAEMADDSQDNPMEEEQAPEEAPEETPEEDSEEDPPSEYTGGGFSAIPSEKEWES